MTQINFLPQLRIQAGVQSNEDFDCLVYFYFSDGVTPLSLTGITFTLSLPGFSYTATSPSTGISIQGADNNCLAIFIPASTVSTWYNSTSSMSILAVGDTSDTVYGIAPTFDVLSDSYLTNGAPNFQLINSVYGTNMLYNALSPISPVVATALNQIANVAASLNQYTVTTSGSITVPGQYTVTVPNLTLTIPSSWAYNPGNFTVLNGYGSGLNCTINGPIYNVPANTITLNNQFSSYGFTWLPTSLEFRVE